MTPWPGTPRPLTRPPPEPDRVAREALVEVVVEACAFVLAAALLLGVLLCLSLPALTGP